MGDLTNYPGGISSFGMPVLPGAGQLPATTGKVFFVCSLGGLGGSASGSNELGTSPDAPFLTIAAAQTAARASKGDIVVILPGHVETVAAASGITLSKAGITYVGFGWGSMRPTLTLSATASTILISGANITLSNVIITSSIDELVTCISVTGAGCTLDRVDYVDGTAVQTLSFLTTAATADDLTMQNCTHQQGTAPATAAAWIGLIGTDRARLINNRFFITQANSASAFVIQSLTTAPLNIEISGNTIVQLGGTTIASAISLVAATSGMVNDNRVASTNTTIANTILISSCYACENYSVNTVAASGLLNPAVDT